MRMASSTSARSRNGTPALDALAHARPVDPLQLGAAQVADLVQEQPLALASPTDWPYMS